MKVNVEMTEIDGAIVVAPDLFKDARGFFQEAFRADEYEKNSLPSQFVQLNHSGSVKDTVRGLHFQWEPPMGKLMRVLRGTAFLVAVDLRRNSPTLGKHITRVLSGEDRKWLWAPASFARGFAVLSEFAEIEYLTTGIYNNLGESGIRWNDSEIGVDWPVKEPILSAKDTTAQTLQEWLAKPESNNFKL
ncbi:MAG: dTDP-4-dehydrorhamnose 3,5-epimerase [Rhizobiales bacterium PAR1]|nr:MAG: dTDP-4-dehydrorhamnose 3,5-epimerase [Rhizobiales bacterium PAR1]